MPLNARVFILQGTYCAMQCISVVYFVQAFQRFGYDNTLIGVIMMLTSIALVAAQPLWGMVADRFENTRLLVLGACGATAALYFLFIYSGGSKPVVIATAIAIYAMFQPMMHLIDAWLSKLIVDGWPINYGASRTGGSIFYAITALGFGLAVSQSSMKLAPWLFLVLLAIMAWALQGIPNARLGRAKATGQKSSGSLTRLLKNKAFLLFVLAYFLMSFTVVPAQTYYSVVLYDLGGNELHVGLGQFLQALFEIPVMLLFEALRRRSGWRPRSFLILAMLGYAAKTALLGFAPGIGVVMAASALQGISYALFLPASLAFLIDTVERNTLSTAQMLSVAVGSSLASIVLNPVCGAIADSLGTQNMLKLMFIFAALAASLMLLGDKYAGGRKAISP